ncbi:hypothetical protein HA145_06845 [Prochlorococcus marinus XMU1411]|uniref:hypothetical protein n=1 Tax=Prochlorococcus marinus TaxID=1219 RepID=UPI001ADB1C17|nr:hypothetical protein [Prochlorococcus marinus]MBO8244193.1 hypothetical protein [Prochlorococcus marinus XMU1411]MBW3055278.1 hypothetical protein [Prochlorococcus marinus str. MU1411]MCR8537021.1 hypothetical protein [Prochlorococcus marinus CUG1430]
MAKKLSEDQKKEITKSFTKGISLDELSETYNFSKLTISRNLKKILGEQIYKDLIKTNRSNKKFFDKKKENQELVIQEVADNVRTNNEFNIGSNDQTSFVEIIPLDYEIDNQNQKDLSSIPVSEINFPKVIYMIVDNKTELEVKILNDYPEWNFLSKEDLNRKTLRIYDDQKNAKRDCNKEQKVIKVPNPDVLKIVAPLLRSRGISRIVSPDKLIAL